MRGMWRTVIALALTPGFVCSSVVARDHVHEADVTHPHAIIHRHLEPHHQHGAEIDHADGRVIWIDEAVITPATPRAVVPQILVSTRCDMPMMPARWIAIASNDAAFPHGPPRLASLLRGPPLLSL